MTKYKLKDKVPCTYNSTIRVIGSNYYLVQSGFFDRDITWQELLNKARMNNKTKYGPCLIIIEEPLNGTVYSYGNYDLTTIYEHGTTKGYA